MRLFVSIILTIELTCATVRLRLWWRVTLASDAAARAGTVLTLLLLLLLLLLLIGDEIRRAALIAVTRLEGGVVLGDVGLGDGREPVARVGVNLRLSRVAAVCRRRVVVIVVGVRKVGEGTRLHVFDILIL